jgi:hypothetical protein
MHRIEVIPQPASRIISQVRGFDVDHDSRREFVIRAYTGDSDAPIEVYECTADDTFALAHVIQPDAGSDYRPADVGDIDEDGLSDLVMLACDPIGGGDFECSTRVYESALPETYPTRLAWEVVHGIAASHGGLIADTDGDGKQEIVIEEPNCPGPGCSGPPALAMYENDGDDSYTESYYELLPGPPPLVLYSHEVGDDLDGDGLTEILIGGWFGGVSRVIAFENTGDTAYEIVWSWDFSPEINVQFVVDGGDPVAPARL